MTEEELERKLGLFPATNIVVANMIGAGIFTTSGLIMVGLNSPGTHACPVGGWWNNSALRSPFLWRTGCLNAGIRW